MPFQGLGRHDSGLASHAPERPRKRIILCFDGTGNKFSGTDADSNILKIYRMLDRTNGDKHYYQPGIGTYVKGSLSHTSRLARINSWYAKAKDSAVGTSFDEHVMGAYKFLMSCYDNDDIYFFGFSRGAYVARFLAEMLDHVGLLSQGNEEMARFAWKAFAQWQQRDESTPEEKEKKKEMLRYLQGFRDTFSRPVRRIRFLGLFDTVNSVPRFENAWMQRNKFPYTARSSAKVIRHAVSIDERRAKFRQDLVSGKNPTREQKQSQWHRFSVWGGFDNKEGAPAVNGAAESAVVDRFRRATYASNSGNRSRSQQPAAHKDRTQRDSETGLFVPPRELSPRPSEQGQGSSVRSGASSFLPDHLDAEDDWAADEAAVQDIEELWFPGCHADLGGGWHLWPNEEASLSHGPLVWMVREAQRAGLEFDQEKMLQLKCCEDPFSSFSWGNNGNSKDTKKDASQRPPAPDIQVIGSSNDDMKASGRIHPMPEPTFDKIEEAETAGTEKGPSTATAGTDSTEGSAFLHALRHSATRGVMHDCLEFRNGLPPGSVLSWKIMEYLPFRRMDLRPDGSWKAISMPLPMGETRDIPADAKIHVSAIERMKHNENYRPGNLIVGGGGRGVRRAPKEMGMGEWRLMKGEGDPVGAVYVRARPVGSSEKTG